MTTNTQNGTINLFFDSTPTVTDASSFKFRIPCNIRTVATPNTPMTATVSINGTATAVPLWHGGTGNIFRSGTDLHVRTCYVATYGSDPSHLMIRKA